MLYIYKIVRLMLIAIIVTYFIGCTWYFFCHTFEQHNFKEEISEDNFLSLRSYSGVICNELDEGFYRGC